MVALLLASPSIVNTVLTGETLIVIDPGHGGADGGVTGTTTKVSESDLNLQMAKVLGEIFSANGYRVILTRMGENSLASGSAKNKKLDDMQRRLKILQKHEPDLMISIHMNKFFDTSRRGSQVFFSHLGDPRSFALAKDIQDELNLSVNKPDLMREYSCLSAQKYLLDQSICPAVIVECGFLSNPIDETKLQTKEYQMFIAKTIYKGADKFLQTTKTDV